MSHNTASRDLHGWCIAGSEVCAVKFISPRFLDCNHYSDCSIPSKPRTMSVLMTLSPPASPRPSNNGSRAESPDSAGHSSTNELPDSITGWVKRTSNRLEELRRFFGLQEGENLIDEYHCALRKRILLQVTRSILRIALVNDTGLGVLLWLHVC